jgi:hypothetical protein
MKDPENIRPSISPDEIDLEKIFVRTVDFFLDNWKIFILANLLAFGAALGYMEVKPKVYYSRFTAQCMSIPDARTIELLNDLDNLRENKDWVLLGKKLGLSPEKVKQIKKLEPLPTLTIDKEAKGVDDYLLATTETAYNFSVVAKVKDNSILPALEKGIIRYLSENEYSKLRVNRFIENRKSLLKSIENELKKLDSLNLLFADKIVHSPSSSTIGSPGDFKAMVITLQEKKLSVEDELKYAQPVRVFQSFTPLKNPIEPVFSIAYLQFFALFNGMGIFIIILRYFSAVYKKNKAQTL